MSKTMVCGLNYFEISWLRYAAGLSGKLNEIFLSLFSLCPQCPVEFSLSAASVFWLFDRSKVAELWENDSLFCPLAVTVDLIVSVGNMASHTTIHSQSPLWMDIPFGKAPRWHCRFSVGCSHQKEWLTVFLKGWAAWRQRAKVVGHLHIFFPVESSNCWEKCFKYKLKFVRALQKQF